jgi:RNA polymerase sigma factor (sigma-70 family)
MAPPHEDINDFELIRRMTDQQADFARAREAWAHFYVRHHDFVLRVAADNHAYLLGMEGVKDVVQDAFMKAFYSAGTFNHAEVCEPAFQERKSRGWLVRIVENLIHDRFRGQPEICIMDEDEMERVGGVIEGDHDCAPPPESERLKVLHSGFALLSDTEQTVLRATMLWWHPEEQHQRMPHAAMQRLSNQIGKTPEAIRQIRSRGLKKLEKYVRENLRDEDAN